MAIGPQTLLFILKVQDQASQALSGAGLAAASLGFAMGAAGAAAVKAQIDFNRTFTQMQTLAGVTAGEVGEVSEAVKTIAVDTGQGPQKLAEALYFASSSGFTTAEAMDVVKASAEGAAIGLGTTEVVADALTSALNAYGHETMTAAEATGIMAVAVQDGKVEATQLAAALGNVIPIASQVGVSFKDVNAAVAAMSLSGLTAAEGVTAVRQTLLAISAPTQQARKVLASMGSSYKEVQEIFRNEGYLVGVQKLREILKGSDVNMRMVLGDVQAVNGNASIMGANLERTKQIFEDVGNAGADSLRKMFDIAAKSDSFKWDQGMALLKVAALDFGDAVMPLVIRAIDAGIKAFDVLKGVISGVTTLWQNHKTAITLVVGAIGTLIILNALPGLLLTAAAAIATATLRMQALTLAIRAFSFASIGTTISGIVTGITLLGQAALAAVPEIGAMAAALWATGIPEVVLAITAVVAAIVWFGNTMMETSEGVASGYEVIVAAWQGLKAFASSIWESIASTVSEAWDTIVTVVEENARAVLAAATSGFSEVVILIYENWDSIVQGTVDAWNSVVTVISDNIRAIIALAGPLGEFVLAVYDNWDSIRQGTVQVWTAITSFIAQNIRTIIGMVPVLGQSALAVYDAYMAVKPALAKAGTEAGNAYRDSLSAAVNSRKDTQVADGLKAKFGKDATVAGLAGFMGRGPKAPPPPKVNAPESADYVPAHKTRAKTGKTEEEKEEERIRKTIEALKVQAQSYAQSAQQVEYLDNVRRAGLNTLTLEQVHLEDGLAITDAQAKASVRLNGIREIARAVQSKHTAELAEANRETTLSIAGYSAVADAERLDARQRAITTAGINAETDALKKHMTAKDAATARSNAERDAAAKFDTDNTRASIQRTNAYDDQVAGLTAQATALTMTARASQVYVAGEKARIAATREGAADVEQQVQRAQSLAGQQYDLDHHMMTMSEGMTKYMDDLKENAISTGAVVYNAMSSAVNGLTDVIGNALTGQSLEWRKTASDVAASIARMIAQMLIMKAVAASLKFLGFATGGTPGTPSYVSPFSGDTAAPFAKGGEFATAAHAANFTPFAKGGDFTNQIVDQATMFAFNQNGNKRMGVMGEAGPEAIMPLLRQGGAMAVAAWAADGTRKALGLTRGPDGKLGVKMPDEHTKAFAKGGDFSSHTVNQNDTSRSTSAISTVMSTVKAFATGGVFNIFKAAEAAAPAEKAQAFAKGGEFSGMQVLKAFADGGTFSPTPAVMAFAKGSEFADRGLVPMRSMPNGAGGNSHSTQYVEGNTSVEVHAPISYTSSGDAQLDKQNIEAMRKVMEATIDDRVGKALEKVGRNGGRMNMFGVN